MRSADILLVTVPFDDGTGAKRRPAFLLSESGGRIRFFRVTSQYQAKSERIRACYFHIENLVAAGLRKDSWIDTVRAYRLTPGPHDVRVVGALSDYDFTRLKDFLLTRLQQSPGLLSDPFDLD